MSLPVTIGLAAVCLILGIIFIMKVKSSKEQHAVPISNPKEIEAFKRTFTPSDSGQDKTFIDKNSNDLKQNLLTPKVDIDEITKRNASLEKTIEDLREENQRIKESQKEKIKILEEGLSTLRKEKEHLVANHKLIEDLKEKGETFEKTINEYQEKQNEIQNIIKEMELERDELIKIQKPTVDQSEFQAISSRLEGSIATIESLKSENKNLQQSVNELKSEFEKTKQHNAHLIEKESIMEYELSKNRAQNLGLEKICEDLKTKIEQLTAVTPE